MFIDYYLVILGDGYCDLPTSCGLFEFVKAVGMAIRISIPTDCGLCWILRGSNYYLTRTLKIMVGLYQF